MNWYGYVENEPVNEGDPNGLQGRGPGHDVSLRRDPLEWLERFKGRRERFDGDPGHEEQLNRCWELSKLLSSTSILDKTLLDELRMQEESARQMEEVWTKILLGDTAIGAVLLAPEGAAAAIIRWISVGGRWVPAH